MVKNWMMLGDEAFDSKSKPVGVIRLTPDEMDTIIGGLWNTEAVQIDKKIVSGQ